ncbi:MAG: phosphodiester glycosidase family protein [Candidatus Peribacteria bacterium]|nr:phosphodiester glycosidase family protein [Candidatus Peribacteria bacterium]
MYERVFKGDGANYSTYWPDTSIRGIFGFEQDGTPLFVQNKISVWDVGLTSNINSERLDDLYFGISNFPVLLIRGEDVTAGAREYIDSKLTGKGSRNFICSTEDGKTVYMGVVGSSSVRDMAPYLKAQFGCYNALFLDAGASLGMVYDGKVLDRGSRRMITDAFVVVDKEAYLKLGGKIPENVTPYQPEYELTEKDMNKIELQSQILDRILKRYAGKVKTPSLLFITPFRKAMTSGKLSVSQKAFYNQLLIHLYTIDML